MPKVTALQKSSLQPPDNSPSNHQGTYSKFSFSITNDRRVTFPVSDWTTVALDSQRPTKQHTKTRQFASVVQSVNWFIKTTASCILQATLIAINFQQHVSYAWFRWDRQVVPRRRYGITTSGCVISQKSTDLKISALPRRSERGLTIRKHHSEAVTYWLWVPWKSS